MLYENTMRHHRIFPLLMSALLLTLISGSVFADLATQTIVNTFNSMNNGKGYVFQAQTSNTYYGQFSGEVRLINSGTNTPNLSAYNIGKTASSGTGSNFFFQSFCVEPERSLYENENTAGKLSYNSSANTTTTSYGNTLKVGVAYLYKEFAAGNLAGYNYTYGNGRVNSAVLLQDAIWFLLGKTANLVNSATSWTNNTFLQQLNGMAGYNQAFWLASYDPASNYGGLMGDAKVFVMNNQFDTLARSPVALRQDLLYVVRGGGGGSDVPEPASILLWTLGSLGAAGMAYRKRKAAGK